MKGALRSDKFQNDYIQNQSEMVTTENMYNNKKMASIEVNRRGTVEVSPEEMKN
jgi:hypothetical protein